MQLEIFQQKLLDWWRREGRVLPWREKVRLQVIGDRFQESTKKVNDTLKVHAVHNDFIIREHVFAEYFSGKLKRDPYRVIVSEVMLQQTQVDRVIPKFNAWMEKWPTIEDLAKASLGEVLIEWQGLGYNRRGRFLWLLAKEIVEQRNGEWPKTESELLKLPGIGKYTARALLSFALGEPVTVVDVNVRRVLQRWFGLRGAQTFEGGPGHSGFIQLLDSKEFISTSRDDGLLTEREWFQLADKMLPIAQADPWNQAMMDFGALICTAKKPKCEACPMFAVCEANQMAIRQGFTSYREMLLEEEVSLPGRNKKKSAGKDSGLKFEQTDRYFRGRIIDALRTKELTEKDLFTVLKTKYNFQDLNRFTKLLENLAKEGLVSTNGKKVKLG